MTLGIIDVGTNSIHLLVGVLGLSGRFHVILKERDLTRLGEGGLASGRLTRRALRRALEVLRRYAEIMDRCRVEHVEAVATSAVREAANGPAFVRAVRRRLGVPLRIISGREEARLIYLGIMQTHRFQDPALILTIGGGSAQVICGDGAKLRYAVSRQLGGARLMQRFIRHDPPQSEETAALWAAVRKEWAPVALALRRHRWRLALGSSATINQLMLAAHLRTHRQPPKRKMKLTLTPPALRRLVDWLAASTAAERIRTPGIDPRREDLMLSTGIALLAWMEACGIRRLRYAEGSLREGLVVDYLLRHRQRVRRLIDASLSDWFSANGAAAAAPPWRPVGLKRRRSRSRRLIRRLSLPH